MTTDQPAHGPQDPDAPAPTESIIKPLPAPAPDDGEDDFDGEEVDDDA